MNSKFLLILICVLFLFTRLYKISEIPGSVYWDEASIGYNAYSIAETGKDEWGKFFPLHFRAFGEFKLPVYIYSVAVFVKIFGLNEFSVRFPAVLFSLGIVLLTYLLSKKISGNTWVGLFSSFFISISPWFFIFSRTGYEATAGLMFYLLGIYAFLFYRKNRWYILLSTISFILSVYSYNSFRIIMPLTSLILIFFEAKNIKVVLRKVILPIFLSMFLFSLSIIPIYRLYILDSGVSRFQAVGIENKWSFFKNYASYFSLEFLLQGDKNLRSQQKGFGQIYVVEVPLLLIGLFSLIKDRSLLSTVLIYLLFISIIPAAITKESPHALRAIAAAPLVSIISSFGTYYICKKMTKKGNVFCSVIIILFTGFFINYFYHFIANYNMEAYQDWQYAYKKINLDYVKEFKNFDHIVISDRYYQPYIFTLFYQHIDPNKFRMAVKYNQNIRKVTSLVGGFDKFIFTNIDYYNLPKGKSLIFASQTDKMDEMKPREIILNPDNSPAAYVYEYQK